MIKIYKNGRIRATGKDANNIVSILRGDSKIKIFNEKYNIGDPVRIRDDNGNEFSDRVAHPATIVGGNTVMVWLDGKGGQNISKVIDSQINN